MRRQDNERSWIAAGLKITVNLAIALLLAGVILCGVNGIGPGDFVFSLQEIASLSAPALVVIACGILLLFFTPLLGLILSTAFLYRGGERRYVAVLVAILCLVVGLVLATL
jgi:uncharacterized membrane protein